MAYLIKLDTHTDPRGELVAIDKVLPFNVARIYYIKKVDADKSRGGHRHFISVEAVVAISGSFTAHIVSPKEDKEYLLQDSAHCMVLEVGDWHEFYTFSPGTILMGLSSTTYDKADYAADPLTVNDGY